MGAAAPAGVPGQQRVERSLGVEQVQQPVRPAEIRGVQGPPRSRNTRVGVIDASGIAVQLLVEDEAGALAAPEQVALLKRESSGGTVAFPLERDGGARRPDVTRVHHDVDPTVRPLHRLDARVVVQEVQAPQVALGLVKNVRVGGVALLEQQLPPDDFLARLDVQPVRENVGRMALVRVVEVEDVLPDDSDGRDGRKVATGGLLGRRPSRAGRWFLGRHAPRGGGPRQGDE